MGITAGVDFIPLNLPTSQTQIPPLGLGFGFIFTSSWPDFVTVVWTLHSEQEEVSIPAVVCLWGLPWEKGKENSTWNIERSVEDKRGDGA